MNPLPHGQSSASAADSGVSPPGGRSAACRSRDRVVFFAEICGSWLVRGRMCAMGALLAIRHSPVTSVGGMTTGLIRLSAPIEAR